MKVTHEWMEAKLRWPLFLGVLLFFGGFLTLAGNPGAGLGMVLFIAYPLALACFNRTEVYLESGRLHWIHRPLYCAPARDLPLQELRAILFGQQPYHAQKSAPPRFAVAFERTNGKRYRVFAGLATEDDARTLAQACSNLSGLPLERVDSLSAGAKPAASQSITQALLLAVFGLVCCWLLLWWLGS